MTLSDELRWRGFVNQTTFKNITELDKKPLTFYWGVDPSASSMTIGNLAAAMMVRHFIDHGHKAVLLVGGATGMIGDPDGKSEERDLKSLEEVAVNKAAIIKQYKTIFGGRSFKIVDNHDWFKNMDYLQFLRDIGKHVPMRQMLSREFVQSRLSEGGAGISYAEFSYVLIQAYDFLHMNRELGVTLQVCGSDQWGNSIAGVDLIRRITGNETHVWTAPLIINKATSVKFGKSEDGAVWLDADKTSVYKFYQFWLNVDDDGVEDYLKTYTELNKEAIDKTMTDFNQNKASRIAQKALAYEVTKVVHGEAQAKRQQHLAEALFGGTGYSQLTKDEIEVLAKELPTATAKAPALIVPVLVASGLVSSLSEGNRISSEGGIYLNGTKVSPDRQSIQKSDIVHGHVILQRGKNKIALIKVT